MNIRPGEAIDTPVELMPLLTRMIELDGSDLLLKVGSPPLLRVDGKLIALEDKANELAPWQTEQLLHGMLSDGRLEDFQNARELDFAYTAPGLARFRATAYLQRGSVSIVLRIVPWSMRSISELGLPDVIRRLAEEPRGLVLVTGTTSSGKSTTLAAMVSHINQTMQKHIVTIEDPIEYLHRDERSAIDQREVGADTGSFNSALRHVLRQDPDVILIGEMRDEETVRTALGAAETGHLVLSTVHTLDAAGTVSRIIDFFRPHEHLHVRSMLAGTLKGIVSQRLAPRADGNGRTPICEVLTMTGRVHDAILGQQDADLSEIIADGAYYGMQTFDQALHAAVRSGLVDVDEALWIASHPHDFKLLVRANAA